MRPASLLLVIALVCACSPAATAPSESPTPSASPTPMPSPTPSPSPAPASAYFIDGTYTFNQLPASLESQVLAGVQTDALKVYINSSAVRTATKGGEPTGAVVLVLGLDPAVSALPGTMQGFINGMTGSAAAGVFSTPETVQIAGRAVTITYHSGQKLYYVVWQHRHFFVTEFASARPVAEDIAATLITANR